MRSYGLDSERSLHWHLSRRFVRHASPGEELHLDDAECSVLDLKTYCYGYMYLIETIKILPQKPDENLVLNIFSAHGATG